MLEDAYAIRDHYLREWIAQGKDAMHPEKAVHAKAHAHIGECLEDALMVCHYLKAKEMHGDTMMGNPHPHGYKTPATPAIPKTM